MEIRTMKLNIFLLLAAFTLSFSGFSQEEGTPSASRKANIKQMLDYRFRGGYYSFERVFNQTVSFPPFAAHNCVMGIVVIAFEVNCDGELNNIRMKSVLGYGIKEEITKFFEATRGQWNKCDDDRYTRFEIPIQFRIKNVETNMVDGILICEVDDQGLMCQDDAYYLKKAQKYLKKGNTRKAMRNIEILLQRDPYNLQYYDMRKKALGEK